MKKTVLMIQIVVKKKKKIRKEKMPTLLHLQAERREALKS
jgi:hypothetical protein